MIPSFFITFKNIKIWTTLFDSTKDGTYIEPKDGSGKTHTITKPTTGEVKIEGKEIGEIDTFIIDQYNQKHPLTVEVRKANLILGSYNDKIGVTESILIPIYESNGWVTIEKTNHSVNAYVYKDDSGDMYVKVTGKKAGTVTLSLTDTAGNVQTPVIKVGSGKSSERVESGGDKMIENNFIQIKSIKYLDQVEHGAVGGITFSISGKPDFVGLTYTSDSGNTIDVPIKIQNNGKYMLIIKHFGIEKQDELELYYEHNGKRYYHKERLLILYSTPSKSNNEDGVVINNQGYVDFKRVVNYIWYNKGYVESYNHKQQKIYDVKEKIKGTTINVILQTIAKGSGYKYNQEYITVQTLPVAGYMLDKFLNGPAQDEFYPTNHWISKRFKQSNDYKNIIGLLTKKDILYLEEGASRLYFKDSSGFDPIFSSFVHLDLYMAVGKYNYSLSVFRRDGVYYTKVRFKDTYDFGEGEYGLGNGSIKKKIADNLNYLGTYHEDFLSGTKFSWEVEIIDKL